MTEMTITRDELQYLKNALDYMQEAIQDTVGASQNDAKTKINYMLQCNRIHKLAMEEIDRIWNRRKKKRDLPSFMTKFIRTLR